MIKALVFISYNFENKSDLVWLATDTMAHYTDGKQIPLNHDSLLIPSLTQLNPTIFKIFIWG